MELRHLRYFVAVAEALNFRAAAKGLHVSAPALSQQVKDLEQEMGVRLFDRDTTRVRLTAAGKVFFEESRALISKACEAQILAKDAARGVSGRLRVGYNSMLLAEYMPLCLMKFSTKFPNILVELVDLIAAEQMEALESDAIQLAFVAPPMGWVLPPYFADASALRGTSHGLVGRGHRLAKRSVVSLADLSQERMLVLTGPKWPVHRDHVCQMFKAFDVPVGELVEVSRIDALLTLVAGGEGVSIIPWNRLMAYEHQVVLLRLKESGPEIFWDIRAVWRPSESTGLQMGFVDVLREVASSASGA